MVDKNADAGHRCQGEAVVAKNADMKGFAAHQASIAADTGGGPKPSTKWDTNSVSTFRLPAQDVVAGSSIVQFAALCYPLAAISGAVSRFAMTALRILITNTTLATRTG